MVAGAVWGAGFPGGGAGAGSERLLSRAVRAQARSACFPWALIAGGCTSVRPYK